MNKKRKFCPNCGSSDIWTIVHGLISDIDEKKLEKDKIKLGGCLISKNSPKWNCSDCGLLWK